MWTVGACPPCEYADVRCGWRDVASVVSRVKALGTMMVRAFMFVMRLIGIVVVVVRAGSGVQRITGPKLTNVTGRSDTAQIPRFSPAGISSPSGASQFCDECETATVEALQEP